MSNDGHAPLPGEVLMDKFLRPKNITMYRLAKAMNVPQTYINYIVVGKKRITVPTAFQLAYVLGTTPEYWLELQLHYDVDHFELDENGLTTLL